MKGIITPKRLVRGTSFMRRKSDEKKRKGSPRWMVTYSDMVTLILVFFILLFSMSRIDQLKFESITESFQNRNVLDFISTDILSEEPSGNNGQNSGQADNGNHDENQNEETDLNELKEQLEKWEDKEDELTALMMDVETFLEEEDLEDQVSATRSAEGVTLVLQDSILFDSGEASLLDSGKPFLNEVARLLSDMPNKVRVEGHTDSRPISTYRYPSNWELSGARAGRVVRHFSEEADLNSNRFLIAGYGDTQPIDPDNMAKNRRVEIVILDEKYEEQSE